MTSERPPRLTVTIRTRLGQVLDMELEPDEASEVHEALIQMVTALFSLDRPEQVRTVIFDFDRTSSQ